MHIKASGHIVRLFAGASLAAICAASSPALAQGADADAESYDGNVIVVTGITKQDADIQEVPTTISAFNAEILKDIGVAEVQEVAAFTPGFNIRGGGNNPTAPLLSMRGQIQNDTLATLEPSVGTYLDGMYIARSYGLNTELLDIKSVQVLKGPQGTLFGRNTSAGALLLETQDPVFGEFSGQLSGTYGRFDQLSGSAILNAGLGEKFAVRGAIRYSERGDYQRDVHTDKGYGARKNVNGRVKVAVKPADNVTVQLSGEWLDGEMNGPGRQNLYFNLGGSGYDPAAAERALFNGDPDLVAVTQPSQVPGTPTRGIFNDIKTQTYMAKVKIDATIGEINWISGFRRIQGDNLIDLDGSSQSAGNHFTTATQDLEQWSTELQLTGSTASSAVDYAVGVTYFKETGTDISRSSTNAGAVWSGFTGDIDNDSMGMYGQVNIHATDALSLVLGGRYSIDDKRVTTTSGAFPFNGSVPAVCLPFSYTGDNNGDGSFTAEDCNRGRGDTWKNFSYTAGVNYKVSDDILIYAKHSKGYRSGAEQLRSLTLTDTAPANPELVYEQELGLKTQFLDGRATFNIAGFHNKVKGAQRSVILAINSVNQTILENADTEAWGLEVDGSIEVTDGLNIFASGSLVDPKYTRYDGFIVVGGALTPNDKKDTNFTGVVEKQFAVGTNYRRDLGFGRLSLSASYSWQDEMFQTERTVARETPALGAAAAAAIIDAATTRAHGITNARASLAFGPEENYEISIWGRNIFDERATFYSLLLGGLYYVGTSYNDPATYGVTATVNF